jgi:hypothetical protein
MQATQAFTVFGHDSANPNAPGFQSTVSRCSELNASKSPISQSLVVIAVEPCRTQPQRDLFEKTANLAIQLAGPAGAGIINNAEGMSATTMRNSRSTAIFQERSVLRTLNSCKVEVDILAAEIVAERARTTALEADLKQQQEDRQAERAALHARIAALEADLKQQQEDRQAERKQQQEDRQAERKQQQEDRQAFLKEFESLKAQHGVEKENLNRQLLEQKRLFEEAATQVVTQVSQLEATASR